MDRDTEHAAIVRSTASAAFAVDTSGRIIAWNAAAEEFCGYPAHKAVGRLCWELVQGRDLYDNVYCGPHCPLIEMAVNRQAIHRCDLLYRSAKGETVRAAVNSVIVSGHSPVEMAIIHILDPVPSKALVEAHRPDSDTGETKHPLLTERELQVLRLMARGAATREIARELKISTGTVRNHTGSILRTLKAHTRLQAVANARALRLVS
jgi:PAS domain S-box-containing protein